MQVKTVDQVVFELARRLSTLVLTPQQLDIMQRTGLDLVYLNGPPGTGKTILLTLVGLRRVRSGLNAHIVSVHDNSRASSRLIKNQLETTLSADSTTPPGCGKVFLHEYNLWNVGEKDRAVKDLAAHGPDLFLICDELVDPGVGHDVPRYFYDLLKELKVKVVQRTVWAAAVLHNRTPLRFTAFPLTAPLRSAPAVLREVETVIVGPWSSRVHPYIPGFPAPGDGLRVEELVHEGSERNRHSGSLPEYCPLCGKNVSDVLRRLGVGVPGSTVSPRDVLVLTGTMRCLRRDASDDDNTTDCRFVQALREAGLAVRVMADRDRNRDTWETDVGELAEASRNEILVTDCDSVHGMERKVVVVLGDDDVLKLFAASRATTQLVTVKIDRT